MKIVVWGINYAPEPTGIGPYNTELCEFLASRGHEVTMVTGFPYYPSWRKALQDRRALLRNRRQNGVNLLRVWLYVPARPNAWRRILHEASFAATSAFRLLTLSPPDLILVVSPPLILGPAAWLVTKLRRTRYVVHIQDMQPDAAIRLGMLRPGLLSRILYGMEALAYKHAAGVTAITEGMLDLLAAKRVPPSRRRLLPNWNRPALPEPAGSPVADFRATYGIDAEDLLVAYSGNLGKKQGLNVLLEAAALLADQPGRRKIRLVIAGDGAERIELAERVAAQGLSGVLLLPLQPEPLYRALLRQANLFVITQRTGSGALFFPSKLLPVLAAGRAALTVSDHDSELARASREGGFGINIEPGAAYELARVLRDLADHPDKVPPMEASARIWSRRYDSEAILARLESDLQSWAHPGTPPLPNVDRVADPESGRAAASGDRR